MCLLDNDVSKSFCKHGHWRKWTCKKGERIWVIQIAEELLEWRPISPVKALARSWTAFLLTSVGLIVFKTVNCGIYLRKSVGSGSVFTCFFSFSVGHIFFFFESISLHLITDWWQRFVCCLFSGFPSLPWLFLSSASLLCYQRPKMKFSS